MLAGSGAEDLAGIEQVTWVERLFDGAQDIDGVRRCLHIMRSRYMRPASIASGCMIEAVVNSGGAEGADELMRQMQDDNLCLESLNAVMYCSILKSFARDWNIQANRYAVRIITDAETGIMNAFEIDDGWPRTEMQHVMSHDHSEI